MSLLQQLAEYHPSKTWCGTGVGEVPAAGVALGGLWGGIILGGAAGLAAGIALGAHFEKRAEEERRYRRAGYSGR